MKSIDPTSLKPGIVAGELVWIFTACWIDGQAQVQVRFSDAKAAHGMIDARNRQGDGGYVRREMGLKIAGRIYMLEDESPALVDEPQLAARDRALAKLTPDEIKALLSRHGDPEPPATGPELMTRPIEAPGPIMFGPALPSRGPDWPTVGRPEPSGAAPHCTSSDLEDLVGR